MKAFTTAFVKAQSEIKPLIKRSKNPFFKSDYADLLEATTIILPALLKHGISVMQGGVKLDGEWVLETKLTHDQSGEFQIYHWPIIAKGSGAQDFAIGSTYARRYALKAFVCAADQDDDGELAQGREHPTTVVLPKADGVVRSVTIKNNGETVSIVNHADTMLDKINAELQMASSPESSYEPVPLPPHGDHRAQQLSDKQVFAISGSGKLTSDNGWPPAYVHAYLKAKYNCDPKSVKKTDYQEIRNFFTETKFNEVIKAQYKDFLPATGKRTAELKDKIKSSYVDHTKGGEGYPPETNYQDEIPF